MISVVLVEFLIYFFISFLVFVYQQGLVVLLGSPQIGLPSLLLYFLLLEHTEHTNSRSDTVFARYVSRYFIC